MKKSQEKHKSTVEDVSNYVSEGNPNTIKVIEKVTKGQHQVPEEEKSREERSKKIDPHNQLQKLGNK